jgi:hypothetical protein
LGGYWQSQPLFTRDLHVRKALPERPCRKLVLRLSGNAKLPKISLGLETVLAIPGEGKIKGPDRNPAGPLDEKGLGLSRPSRFYGTKGMLSVDEPEVKYC